MKTLILICIYLLSFSSILGQKNTFNFDLGGIASHTTSINSWGAGIYTEPKYNITDHFAIGLKMDWTLSFGGSFSSDGSVKFDVDEFLNDNDPYSIGITNNDYNITELGFEMSRMRSIVITGDYLIIKKPFTPFIGFGIGYYEFDEYSFSLNTFSHDSKDEFTTEALDGSSMGVLIRTGIQMAAFRISGEYNWIFNPAKYNIYFNANGTQGSVIVSHSKISKSYIGIKIGAVIKGGRRSFDVN